VVERYAYTDYGCPTITDGAGGAVAPNAWGTAHSAVGNPYLFTGRRWDEESGLYYYRARYYDCEGGRFLQRDPLGYEDGMAVFLYVRSRPTRFLDPSGLACRGWCAGIERFPTSNMTNTGLWKRGPCPNGAGRDERGRQSCKPAYYLAKNFANRMCARRAKSEGCYCRVQEKVGYFPFCEERLKRLKNYDPNASQEDQFGFLLPPPRVQEHQFGCYAVLTGSCCEKKVPKKEYDPPTDDKPSRPNWGVPPGWIPVPT
jgi:RHS repeat-associated protein